MRGNPTVEFTCDRCGAQETTLSTDRPTGWRVFTTPQLIARDLNDVTKYDLCLDCDQSFDAWLSLCRDVPREETARCGNCPHDPDAHSPVGLELCSFRGCECQGLLTVTPREDER